VIEREHLRKGYQPTRSEDLYPQPTTFESVRAVRADGAGSRDDYDLDDAWWAESVADGDAPTYADWMGERGFVQVWSPELGMRVWRHQ